MTQRFPKEEKLKSKVWFDQLFVDGQSKKDFPIKAVYLSTEKLPLHQAGFSVPKRQIKSAVDRNRIKRQMREAFRLNKHSLPDSDSTHFAVLFIFLGRGLVPYQEIEKSIKALISKLSASWKKTNLN